MYKRKEPWYYSDRLWLIIFGIMACITLTYAIYITMGHTGGPKRSVSKKKSDEQLFNWLITPVNETEKVCAN